MRDGRLDGAGVGEADDDGLPGAPGSALPVAGVPPWRTRRRRVLSTVISTKRSPGQLSCRALP
ncbi:hypothetical protein ARTHRO9AX_150046 [Arthrobacter sp. 9AX]|nr:hypothetical protein ARTHRO9AX_150046 [Arthrobacter sp. 9AX]